MKKLLFITVLLVFTTSNVLSQKMNRQKIKLLKTAFITDAIALKSNEAEKFWPIYNNYSNQIQQLKFKLEGGKMQEIKAAGGIESVSEVEAQKIVNQSLNYEKEIYEAKIKMVEELSKIISTIQIVKLQKAERNFNKRILQEYGRRKRMGQ